MVQVCLKYASSVLHVCFNYASSMIQADFRKSRDVSNTFQIGFKSSSSMLYVFFKYTVIQLQAVSSSKSWKRHYLFINMAVSSDTLSLFVEPKKDPILPFHNFAQYYSINKIEGDLIWKSCRKYGQCLLTIIIHIHSGIWNLVFESSE